MAKVRADALLVMRGLSESRAKAQAAIAAQGVRANGFPVTKSSEMLEPDTVLEVRPAHPWVGRGALKLVYALDIWPIALTGRCVLDIGASTGGFTEVCIARGASRVYAVDVGQNQLHPRLRQDGRVVVLEGVDARGLDQSLIPQAPDAVVCDASFIGLSKVLPAALTLARSGADLIALIKPQFEAGPEQVGKGGLVRDLDVLTRVQAEVSEFLESVGWTVLARAESPISGGAGQREYLIRAVKRI
ncbi:MAG: TlyA family rRNA (cytidine-2'-O)-methyltransferase [Phenylobacterium zucineum]|nr:MAG: TlyA family rRNA (cytidine-2'-O)-methyltransferase [Phenylobacterium zucineum]